jgi:hypothetical protein
MKYAWTEKGKMSHPKKHIRVGSVATVSEGFIEDYIANGWIEPFDEQKWREDKRTAGLKKE